MKKILKSRLLLGITALFLVGACTPAPHLKEWNRDKLTLEDIDKPLHVGVCFDNGEHSREEVYEVARQECAQKIQEIETLKLTQNSRKGLNNPYTAQSALGGPIKRQARIDAMVRSLKLVYQSNSVWDCPLMTPNYVSLSCSYDQNATESLQPKSKPTKAVPFPDLPPELPADLKPQ